MNKRIEEIRHQNALRTQTAVAAESSGEMNSSQNDGDVYLCPRVTDIAVMYGAMNLQGHENALKNVATLRPQCQCTGKNLRGVSVIIWFLRNAMMLFQLETLGLHGLLTSTM